MALARQAAATDVVYSNSTRTSCTHNRSTLSFLLRSSFFFGTRFRSARKNCTGVSLACGTMVFTPPLRAQTPVAGCRSHRRVSPCGRGVDLSWGPAALPPAAPSPSPPAAGPPSPAPPRAAGSPFSRACAPAASPAGNPCARLSPSAQHAAFAVPHGRPPFLSRRALEARLRDGVAALSRVGGEGRRLQPGGRGAGANA